VICAGSHRVRRQRILSPRRRSYSLPASRGPRRLIASKRAEMRNAGRMLQAPKSRHRAREVRSFATGKAKEGKNYGHRRTNEPWQCIFGTPRYMDLFAPHEHQKVINNSISRTESHVGQERARDVLSARIRRAKPNCPGVELAGCRQTWER